MRIQDASNKNTASKIVNNLKKLFQDNDPVAQMQQTFYQRDQKVGGSLQEYSLVLLKLAGQFQKKAPSAMGNMDVLPRERFNEGILDK